MGKIRLRAYLMRSGEFDKSYQAIKLVKESKIFVCGQVVRNPELSIKTKDLVQVLENKKLKTIKPRNQIYIIFNKPKGVVCQKTNKEPSIYDLINKIPEFDRETKKSLFTIGRLDKDTEGLLIVTNDGKLESILMNPENKTPKTYFIIAEKNILRTDLEKLENGVKIKVENNEVFVKALGTKPINPKTVEIMIYEGKKRQIRLMFSAIGNDVIYLKRVGIGKLRIENLDFGRKHYLVLDKEGLKKILF